MYAITQNKASSGWYKMSTITENIIRMIQDVYNDTISTVRLIQNVYSHTEYHQDDTGCFI